MKNALILACFFLTAQPVLAQIPGRVTFQEYNDSCQINGPGHVNFNVPFYNAGATNCTEVDLIYCWLDSLEVQYVYNAGGGLTFYYNLNPTNYGVIFLFPHDTVTTIAQGIINGVRYVSDTVYVPTFPCQVLPVEWGEVDVVTSGGLPEIFWRTFNETNNHYFTLMRSSDGVLWTAVVDVEADNTEAGSYYSLTDSSYSGGNMYYMVGQTDFDGVMSHSSQILYRPEQTAQSLKIFPNPVTDHFTVKGISGGWSLALINMQSRSVTDLAGEGEAEIDASTLSTGVYVVRLLTERGEVFTQRLIIR